MSSSINQFLRHDIPKGFAVQTQAHLDLMTWVITTLNTVYRRYGYELMETPFLEYAEALGKFLPDDDRPNQGVFSFQDYETWLSLRYDLTAPLARYVAHNLETLTLPLKSLRYGYVFRNEKPDPGRFKQFIQYDADIIGTSTLDAEVELCLLTRDAFKALGLEQAFRLRFNHRKILEGMIQNLCRRSNYTEKQKIQIYRTIDKLDKLSLDGLIDLLGNGRRDSSGAFIEGVGLNTKDIERICAYLTLKTRSHNEDPFSKHTLNDLRTFFSDTELALQGIEDLSYIGATLEKMNFPYESFSVDRSIVRGLDYYTGPVFEVEFHADGQSYQSSIGGGGRYDTLIQRYRSEALNATGFSLGLSRFISALQSCNHMLLKHVAAPGPVYILVLDKEYCHVYHAMAAQLREHGIHCAVYLGDGNLKKQLKYADRVGSPCALIQGEQERLKQEVQIKDLIEGKQATDQFKTKAEWKTQNSSQRCVPIDTLVPEVKRILSKHFSL